MEPRRHLHQFRLHTNTRPHHPLQRRHRHPSRSTWTNSRRSSFNPTTVANPPTKLSFSSNEPQVSSGHGRSVLCCTPTTIIFSNEPTIVRSVSRSPAASPHAHCNFGEGEGREFLITLARLTIDWIWVKEGTPLACLLHAYNPFFFCLLFPSSSAHPCTGELFTGLSVILYG